VVETIIRSIQQGFAASGLRNSEKITTIQHQNVRTENGIEYGDLPKL